MSAIEETVIMMDENSRQRQNERAAGATVRFEDVYHRYLKPVYAFIAWRVPERSTAEDITSQVFEKAWRSFRGFDPARGGASAWIFTIARNCLADHYRRRGRIRETAMDARLPAPDSVDPQVFMESAAESHMLREAVRALKPAEQEIVALKFGAAMNNRDIGRLLGISETNVGTILYRSLKRLKAMLEDGIDDE